MFHVKIVNGHFCTVFPYVPPKEEDYTLGWSPTRFKRSPVLTQRAYFAEDGSDNYAATKEDLNA